MLYTGALNDRLDVRLIDEVTAALPEVVFEFVGPTAPTFAPVRRANLVVQDAVAHDAIPALLRRATAVWLPYRNAPNQAHIGAPLKFFEALIAGNLVVRPQFLDVGVDAAAFARGASTTDEWVRSLQWALAPHAALRDSAIAYARTQTYAQRVRDQVDVLAPLVEQRRRHAH